MALHSILHLLHHRMDEHGHIVLHTIPQLLLRLLTWALKAFFCPVFARRLFQLLTELSHTFFEPCNPVKQLFKRMNAWRRQALDAPTTQH